MISELSTLSDKQVAERMVGYMQRSEVLRKKISAHLDNPRVPIDRMAILDEYARLKSSIREDAHWLSLTHNSWFRKTNDLRNAFHNRLVETAAFGYKRPTNSGINFKLYCAVEEGAYKLSKTYLLEDWIEYAK